MLAVAATVAGAAREEAPVAPARGEAPGAVREECPRAPEQAPLSNEQIPAQTAEE